MNKKYFFTEKENDTLKSCYADTPSECFAEWFDKPLHVIYHQANKLKLHKKKEYLSIKKGLDAQYKWNKNNVQIKAVRKDKPKPIKLEDTKYKMGLIEKIIYMHFRCHLNENTIAILLDYEIAKSPLSYSTKYKNTKLSPLIFVTNTIVTEREQIYKNNLIENI